MIRCLQRLLKKEWSGGVFCKQLVVVVNKECCLSIMAIASDEEWQHFYLATSRNVFEIKPFVITEAKGYVYLVENYKYFTRLPRDRRMIAMCRKEHRVTMSALGCYVFLAHLGQLCHNICLSKRYSVLSTVQYEPLRHVTFQVAFQAKSHMKIRSFPSTKRALLIAVMVGICLTALPMCRVTTKYMLARMTCCCCRLRSLNNIQQLFP